MSIRNVVNRDQADAWDGEEGAHWADHADRYEAMSGGFTDQLLASASIRVGDHVLDIGCGNGRTTVEAAGYATAGQVLGVDLSSRMLDHASASAAAEGLTNVRFEQADAQAHSFANGTFDVAISRFGIMFFADPVAAFANIGRSLRSGGRATFLCWQEMSRNDWLLVPASAALQYVAMPDLGDPGAPGPFSMSDPDRIVDILGRAGFEQVRTDPLQASMRLGDDADDAVAFLRGTGMARAMLSEASVEDADRALAAVADALRPHEAPAGVHLGGAAWLVTATRP